MIADSFSRPTESVRASEAGAALGRPGPEALSGSPRHPLRRQSYTLHWFDNFGNPPAQPGRGQWKGDTLAFEHDMGKHQGRTIFELDDHRRAISVFADAIEGDVFDESKAGSGAELRLESANRLRGAVLSALGRLHKLLDPQQRARLAYLIRTRTLSI